MLSSQPVLIERAIREQPAGLLLKHQPRPIRLGPFIRLERLMLETDNERMKKLLLIPLLLVSCSKSERPATTTKSGAEAKVVAKTDETGKPTEKIFYNSDGSINHRTIFQTDPAGTIRSAKTLDGAGKIEWTETYTYDSSTNLLETRRTMADANLILIRYRFLPDGRPSGRIVIGPDGKEIPPDQQKDCLGE